MRESADARIPAMSAPKASRLLVLLACAAAALAALPAAALAADGRAVVARPIAVSAAWPIAAPVSAALAGRASGQDPATAVTLAIVRRRTVWTGRAVTLSGAVSPAQPEGTVVTVEWRPRGAGEWATLTTTTLAADSTYSVRWTPALDPHGYLELRASVPDGAGGAVSSPARRLTLNPANQYHVLFKYAHFIVIVVHEYQLYYYEHGVLIRRFDVALGRPGFPTPIGTFHVYGKRKPAGGPEGACAMFYRAAGGIAIHGTDRPWLDQPAGPAQLLARLRTDAQQAGALAVPPRACGDDGPQLPLGPSPRSIPGHPGRSGGAPAGPSPALRRPWLRFARYRTLRARPSADWGLRARHVQEDLSRRLPACGARLARRDRRRRHGCRPAAVAVALVRCRSGRLGLRHRGEADRARRAAEGAAHPQPHARRRVCLHRHRDGDGRRLRRGCLDHASADDHRLPRGLRRRRRRGARAGGMPK